MAAGFNNCQVIEAIQSLPPELREIIYKHFLTIKLRERAALGWDLVHDELLIQPFCPERQRLVHILVCVAYMHCCQGGCCYPCYKQEEILHELTISVTIYDISLVKYCTDTWGEDHIPYVVFNNNKLYYQIEKGVLPNRKRCVTSPPGETHRQ